MPEFIFPTTGPLTSGYGPRGGGFHSGLDFGGWDRPPCGEPVFATADGVVIVNGWEAAAGWIVTIQHAGIRSGVFHLERPSPIPVGAHVTQGQVIGQIGNTGSGSRGCHAHFWMGEGPNPPKSIDPLPLLSSPTPEPPAPSPALPEEDDDMTVWLVFDEGPRKGAHVQASPVLIWHKPNVNEVSPGRVVAVSHAEIDAIYADIAKTRTALGIV